MRFAQNRVGMSAVEIMWKRKKSTAADLDIKLAVIF